jgi:CubicO group peptidase (beta-lactamase class C family)
MSTRKSWCVVATLGTISLLVGCGSSGDGRGRPQGVGGATSNAGAGGDTASSGGASPGGAGPSAGVGGVRPSSGGSSTTSAGGAGTSTGGSAGASSGTGGAAASTGGNGGASSGTGGAMTGAGGAPTMCLGKLLPAHAADPILPAGSLAPYFPTTEFRTAMPAEAGFDATKLAAAVALAPTHSHTQGLIVLRHGYVVAERYVAPFTATTLHESASVAKSFSSALVGIAIKEGLLPGVDEPICKYYTEWGCDPSNQHSKITIAHVMNLKTGIQWTEDWRIGYTGTNDAFSPNLLDLVLSRPVVDPPGTKQRYSTGDPALLSGVIQKVAGKTAFEYAKEKVFKPLGISTLNWNSDNKGRTTTFAGIQATVRDYAKFGFLYLRHGQWDGQEVVPGSWIDFTTRAVDPCHQQYSYLWHINLPIRLGDADPKCSGFLQCDPTTFADLPASGFFAIGVYGQLILILPSADIVIARVGQDDAGAEYWDQYTRDLMQQVLAAVVN